MTIYEIPNIENCEIREERYNDRIVGYTIISNSGWYIHLNDGDEETANLWKWAVCLPASYNFSQVEIRAEADLPEDAEICGDHNEEVTE